MARARSLAPERLQPAIFEVCVRGTAFSAQAKGVRGKANLKAWRDEVAAAARLEVGQASLLSGDLELRICEFSSFAARDRDNVAKPIQDALQGVVYANDRQVKLCQSEWCDIDGAFKVRYLSSKVADAMVIGHDFVWLRIFVHQPIRELR